MATLLPPKGEHEGVETSLAVLRGGVGGKVALGSGWDKHRRVLKPWQTGQRADEVMCDKKPPGGGGFGRRPGAGD